MYNLPNASYLLKSIPLQGNWIKADWMRAGSSPHVQFAGEQVIDQLAYLAGMDAAAFRIQNVSQGAEQPYLLAVLNAVTQAANWQPRVAASQLSDANIVTGRGLAWGNAYGATEQNAVIADVEVNKKTGKITVKHLYSAFSTGYAVNPGLVENQMVGGAVQITSRALVEELRYNHTNVTSLDFVTYPLLRFIDAPQVTPIVVQETGLQPQKVGEPVTQATPAAIANAFFDATGVRMHTAPMTPTRVLAALAAGGAGTAGVA
jgi:CO/xanthine dehydrogenase Mo-binding subunit